MILDNNSVFDPAGTAVTVTADSTNTLDLVNNRDIGPGLYNPAVLVIVGTSFTSATASATLNVQLLGAPDNGSGAAGGYELIGESGVTPLGFMQAGYKIAQFKVPPIADAVGNLAAAGATISTTSASTTATVSSATGLLQGMVLVSSGIVPGTTISSISGTTVTLSQNASATTTSVAFAALGSEPPYRFLKLHYIASNTMTAGTVTSYLGQDIDEVVYYKSGFVVNN